MSTISTAKCITGNDYSSSRNFIEETSSWGLLRNYSDGRFNAPDLNATCTSPVLKERPQPTRNATAVATISFLQVWLRVTHVLKHFFFVYSGVCWSFRNGGHIRPVSNLLYNISIAD